MIIFGEKMLSKKILALWGVLLLSSYFAMKAPGDEARLREEMDLLEKQNSGLGRKINSLNATISKLESDFDSLASSGEADASEELKKSEERITAEFNTKLNPVVKKVGELNDKINILQKKSDLTEAEEDSLVELEADRDNALSQKIAIEAEKKKTLSKAKISIQRKDKKESAEWNTKADNIEKAIADKYQELQNLNSQRSEIQQKMVEVQNSITSLYSGKKARTLNRRKPLTKNLPNISTRGGMASKEGKTLEDSEEIANVDSEPGKDGGRDSGRSLKEIKKTTESSEEDTVETGKPDDKKTDKPKSEKKDSKDEPSKKDSPENKSENGDLKKGDVPPTNEEPATGGEEKGDAKKNDQDAPNEDQSENSLLKNPLTYIVGLGVPTILFFVFKVIQKRKTLALEKKKPVRSNFDS